MFTTILSFLKLVAPLITILACNNDTRIHTPGVRFHFKIALLLATRDTQVKLSQHPRRYRPHPHKFLELMIIISMHETDYPGLPVDYAKYISAGKKNISIHLNARARGHIYQL